jgi:hypothetical protein
MKTLVAVKRAVGHNIKVRVKPYGFHKGLRTVKMVNAL